jgi:hypothetical protein
MDAGRREQGNAGKPILKGGPFGMGRMTFRIAIGGLDGGSGRG